MNMLARILLVIVPYVALTFLAITWTSALYLYRDEPVALHAKWAIPVLLVYSTILHLRTKCA